MAGPKGNEVAVFPPFPPFPEWLGRRDGVPGGAVLRDAHCEAYYTRGSAGPDSSIHEYRCHLLHPSKTSLTRSIGRTRQMQNVPVAGIDRAMSSDHTFDTAKNFLSEEGMPNPEAVLLCCYPFSLAPAGVGHGDWALESSDCHPHTLLRR